MKIWKIPAASAERRSSGLVHGGFDRGQSPAQNENGKNGERHPRARDLSGSVFYRSVRCVWAVDAPFVAHGIANRSLLNRVRIGAALLRKAPNPFRPRSEERRVGKECRSRW